MNDSKDFEVTFSNTGAKLFSLSAVIYKGCANVKHSVLPPLKTIELTGVFLNRRTILCEKTTEWNITVSHDPWVPDVKRLSCVSS